MSIPQLHREETLTSLTLRVIRLEGCRGKLESECEGPGIARSRITEFTKHFVYFDKRTE